METKFSDASVAFVELNGFLDDKKYLAPLKRRKNRANAKGRVRRMQTIAVYTNGKKIIKQIIHFQFYKHGN